MISIDIDGYTSVVDILRDKEKFLSKPTHDSIGGVWNIGYGTTHYLDGKAVTKNDKSITEPEAYSYLCYYLNLCIDAGNKYIIPILDTNKSQGVVIFMYNVGIPSFIKSTLLKVINSSPNNLDAIAKEWKRWIYSQGKIIEGLKNRRTLEWRIFANNPTAKLF